MVCLADASSEGIRAAVVATWARIGHIQSACQSGFEALPGQLGAVLLGVKVLSGNGDSLLKGSEVDVVPCDFGRERYEHVATCFHAGLEIGVSSLDAASNATEDVQFQAASKPAKYWLVVTLTVLSLLRPVPVVGRLTFHFAGKTRGVDGRPRNDSATPLAARACRTRASANLRSRLDSTACWIRDCNILSSKTVHQLARSFSAGVTVGKGAALPIRKEPSYQAA